MMDGRITWEKDRSWNLDLIEEIKHWKNIFHEFECCDAIDLLNHFSVYPLRYAIYHIMMA